MCIPAQMWESISKRFPGCLPFWTSPSCWMVERTSWQLWILPKSTTLKSIFGHAPGRLELLTRRTSLRLLLSFSCLHSFWMLSALLGSPWFIQLSYLFLVRLTAFCNLPSFMRRKCGLNTSNTRVRGVFVRCRIMVPKLYLLNQNLNFNTIPRWFNMH